MIKCFFSILLLAALGCQTSKEKVQVEKLSSFHETQKELFLNSLSGHKKCLAKKTCITEPDTRKTNTEGAKSKKTITKK